MTSNIDTINEHEDSIDTFNDDDRIDTTFNDNDRRWKKQMKENKLKDAIDSFNDNNTNPERRVDAHQKMLDKYDLDGDGKLNISEQQNIGHDMLRMEDIAKMLKKGLIFVSVLAVGFMISNIGTVYFVVWLTKDVKVTSDGVMQNMNGGNVKTEGIAPMITLYDVSDEGGTRRGLRSKRAFDRKLGAGSDILLRGIVKMEEIPPLLKSGTVELYHDNGMKSCTTTGFENKSDTLLTLETSCGTGTLELNIHKDLALLSIGPDSNNNDQQGLQFSIFGDHACALFSKEVHCVGNNSKGQLGTGDTENRLSPTKMLGLEYSKTPLQVVTGNSHTCVLVNENDGSVYCVGRNNNGQLGNDDPNNNDSAELVQVVNKDDNNTPLTNIKQIAAGAFHNCAILEDDSLYCWGLNTFNRLAFNNGVGTDVKFMALSKYRTCIVTASNTNQVQCTLGASTDDLFVTIEFGDVITKLTAGDNHFCALLKDRTAKCFGNNLTGQLGIGSTGSITDWSSTAQPVRFDANSELSEITDINAGRESTCLVADGEPMCFGYNEYHQLGIDNAGSNVLYPTRVPLIFPVNKQLVSVHVGLYTGHAVFSDNTVYSWGDNRYGAFGDGSNHRIFGNVRAARMNFWGY